MSDRKKVVSVVGEDNSVLDVFMDGETGTWRIFIDNECMDISLSGLESLSHQLSEAIADVERNPEELNAEARAANKREAEAEIWVVSRVVLPL